MLVGRVGAGSLVLFVLLLEFVGEFNNDCCHLVPGHVTISRVIAVSKKAWSGSSFPGTKKQTVGVLTFHDDRSR